MTTVETILALCKRLEPTAGALTLVTEGTDANTRFAKNEITSSGEVDEAQVMLSLAFGQRVASTTRNQTDEASLQKQIETTARLARLAPEDPEAMAVLPAQPYQRYPSELDAATVAVGAGHRAKVAREAIAAAEKDQLQVAGFIQTSHWRSAIGTSAGLRSETEGTDCSLSMTARTADGTGSGWSGAHSHRIADIDAPALTRTAMDKAVRSAKPRKLDPGRYTVVLESEAVSDLLMMLGFALDARMADEGRSPFSRAGGGSKVGELLFAPSVSIACDAINPQLPITAFDGEGLARRPYMAVERGKLKQLSCSRYWAAKTGQQATGHPASVALAPGPTHEPDLVKGCQRGLLITRFWYVRMVDPTTLLLTGLTRDGVFLIENGQVVAPVNNFRFNESPLHMLKNVEAIGDIVRRGDVGAAPALRTAAFNMASVSDAV